MEITLCLIPLMMQCQVIQDIVTAVDPNPLPNTPHISLFQMNTDALPDVIDHISQYTIQAPQITFTVDRIANKYENIALHIRPTHPEQFTSFKSQIIEDFKGYRSSHLMDQIDESTLDETQKELVKNYGIHWGVGPYVGNNHLTLSYDHQLTEDHQVPAVIQTLTCGILAIGEIDISGNIVKVLWQKPLSEYDDKDMTY